LSGEVTAEGNLQEFGRDDDRKNLARIHQPENADACKAMLKPELLPGTSSAKGYRGSYLLRREARAEIEFIL
jgi:hypothetical protein